jgi:arylsulfatase A-like enzyme
MSGMKPWNNGQLAYGSMGPEYKQELPKEMVKLGYHTAIVGKNHFGWNSTTGQGVTHGYEYMKLYDGLNPMKRRAFKGLAEFDDYDKYFGALNPGKSPFADGISWNSW